MDFTISQIGAIANHPLRRPESPGSGLRAVADEPVRPVDAVPSPAAAGLNGLDTEYDQFGRFATASPTETGRPNGQRPPMNPAAKYFRSGKVTAQELEREYARSLIDSYVAENEGGGVRRFIPAGMTEYQVNQLSDHQYRWAIEAECRALERTERDKASVTIHTDSGGADSGAAADKVIR